MEAYIVTPHRQKIPDNIDIAKVRLCRLLDSLWHGEGGEYFRFTQVCQSAP